MHISFKHISKQALYIFWSVENRTENSGIKLQKLEIKTSLGLPEMRCN
jgi:hypothetical protein